MSTYPAFQLTRLLPVAVRNSIRSLLSNQQGDSALEHTLMLSLVALGTTSVTNSAASIIAHVLQALVSTLNTALPT